MPYLQRSLDLADLELAFPEVVLHELSALSVSPGPAGDDLIVKPAPGAMPLWQQTRVASLFAADTNPDDLTAELNRLLGHGRLLACRLSELGDRDCVAEIRDKQRQRLDRSVWDSGLSGRRAGGRV
ncbi:MAG: hypothetical protein V3S70_06000 [Gammaproteobacteria bacterium]